MPRAARRVVRAAAVRARHRDGQSVRTVLKAEVKPELETRGIVDDELQAQPVPRHDVAAKAELEPEHDVKAEPMDKPFVKNELAAESCQQSDLIDVEDAWQPLGWTHILDGVRSMRAKRAAPVDTMGCERVGSKEENTLDARTVRYQHLVALMLSAQTRDEVTAAAVDRLREALDPTLTPEAVVATSESVIADLIHPVGFYRRKAAFIREAAHICIERYGGDVPRTLEEITQLPGVGPKMGHLLLQSAWNEVHGIGVDVHVHRLANLWGWVPQPTRTPEQTRIALEKWMPRDLWREINPLLVGFGQTWCPSRSSVKTCNQCELNDKCSARQR